MIHSDGACSGMSILSYKAMSGVASIRRKEGFSDIKKTCGKLTAGLFSQMGKPMEE